MFHFPGLSRADLWIQSAVRRLDRRGLPHSEIPGSRPVCGSPRLIAAYHVLHRLLAPRHPPYALSSLTATAGFFHSRRKTLRSVAGARHLPALRSLFILTRLSKNRERRAAVAGDALSRFQSEGPAARILPLQTSNFKPVPVARGARGGAEGDRTPDLRLAKPALSQLSYGPTCRQLPAGRPPTRARPLRRGPRRGDGGPG